MLIHNKNQFNHYLKSLICLGWGSQGCCYLDPKLNLVYKVFYEWEESLNDIDKESILQFKNIHNSTFVFPKDVILYQDKVIGYVTNYVKAQNLSKVDPLTISFESFIFKINNALNDIMKISQSGIHIYDLMYNIMLGRKIYIIDTMEYTIRDIDEQLFQKNVQAFNLEVMYFLVDGYFDKVVDSNPLLKDMYASHGKNISITEFITIFQKYLSELVGSDIRNLKMAQSLIEITGNQKYARTLSFSK